MSSIPLYIWLPAGRHTVLSVGFRKLEGLQSIQIFKDRWNFSRCRKYSLFYFLGHIYKTHLWFLCTGITEKTYYGMELLLVWSNPWTWGILNSLDTQLIFMDSTLRIVQVETDFRRLKAGRNVITRLLRAPKYFKFHILQSSNLVSFILKQCRGNFYKKWLHVC